MTKSWYNYTQNRVEVEKWVKEMFCKSLPAVSLETKLDSERWENLFESWDK